ncbi:hypothetical protein H312_01096 [Anncaliia algerae PRA339]|uniref:Uncharacterized protein n=1 Tax=Anncaliia algerae PRA339 TaxID=1288291 RepID=A0A059F2N3_9MICR|nr:hypothetical protein H312_01096 [Anncaliia algerae PRA339]
MPMLAFILLSYIFTAQGSDPKRLDDLLKRTIVDYDEIEFISLLKFDKNQDNITKSKSIITSAETRFSLLANNLETFLKSDMICSVIYRCLEFVEEIIDNLKKYFDLGENKNSQLHENYKKLSSDINDCKQKIYDFISLPRDKSNPRRVIDLNRILNYVPESEQFGNFKNELLKMSELLTKIREIYDNIWKL